MVFFPFCGGRLDRVVSAGDLWLMEKKRRLNLFAGLCGSGVSSGFASFSWFGCLVLSPALETPNWDNHVLTLKTPPF